MIDFNRIKRLTQSVNDKNEKLKNNELDNKKRTILKLQVQIDLLKIKIERLN